MKLGINTVWMKRYTLHEAMAAAKRAGYDGVELSAIAGMCEHLVLDEWERQADDILTVAQSLGLALLSMEVASLEEARLEKAFAAARGLGIPIVNVGPGGTEGDAESLAESIATLRRRADRAAFYGVTLCTKAHVGAAIHDTATTRQAMDAIAGEAFGIDMDPSHIYRAGELPEVAVADVVDRVRHIHVRDCVGRGPSPGTPLEQTCGRGDIHLFAYFEALVAAGYAGPVCLEIIGPEQDRVDAMAIAAESYGYMNACLKRLGVR